MQNDSKTYFELKDSNTQKMLVPYDLPPIKYADNDKPWCYDVTYKDEDSHGRTWIVN